MELQQLFLLILFVDETPLEGNNYYRLRQTDYDGKASFSEVKIVSFESALSEVKSS